MIKKRRGAKAKGKRRMMLMKLSLKPMFISKFKLYQINQWIIKSLHLKKYRLLKLI